MMIEDIRSVIAQDKRAKSEKEGNLVHDVKSQGEETEGEKGVEGLRISKKLEIEKRSSGQ